MIQQDLMPYYPGLQKLVPVSRLRVLDLSDGVYSTQQLSALAERVISHHANLVTLKLKPLLLRMSIFKPSPLV